MPAPSSQKRSGISIYLPYSVVFLGKCIWYFFVSFLTLLVTTVTTLIVINTLSKTNSQEKRFPHMNFDKIDCGENSLQLYSYGQDLYAAMLEAIDDAQESIYLETYIWKDDDLGYEFKKHLVRKARAGVHVYVIFDNFANLVVHRVFKLFPPEVHVLNYRIRGAIRTPWQALNPLRYALDHRKLLVVDGRVSFIGGYNIGGLYATQWRDTHLRIKGPFAANLALSFQDFWNLINRREQIVSSYHRTFNPLINVIENNALQATFPIRNMYISAIDKATSTILLTNAYFVPDHVLLNHLKDAARRGVTVNILVPWHSNHVVVDWLSRGYFKECLDAGIHVLGYSYTMLHAKTCMVDDYWVTIGTANLDRLSEVGNYEVNVEVYSSALARQMQTLFDCDTEDVFEFTLAAWQRRPWYAKLGERILAPLRNFL